MGQIQPKEEAPDAPDSLVRRLPTEVHGGKRHVDMQVNSLTRLDVIRRKEVERKEEIVSFPWHCHPLFPCPERQVPARRYSVTTELGDGCPKEAESYSYNSE